MLRISSETSRTCRTVSAALALSVIAAAATFFACYYSHVGLEYTVASSGGAFAAVLCLGLYLGFRNGQEATLETPPARPLPVTVSPANVPAARIEPPALAPPPRVEPPPRVLPPPVQAPANRAAVGSRYAARVGIPNPSSRNCPYNSMSIAIAHADHDSTSLMQPLPPQPEEIPDRRDEMGRSHRQELDQLREKRDRVFAEYSPLKERLDGLKEELHRRAVSILRERKQEYEEDRQGYHYGAMTVSERYQGLLPYFDIREVRGHEERIDEMIRKNPTIFPKQLKELQKILRDNINDVMRFNRLQPDYKALVTTYQQKSAQYEQEEREHHVAVERNQADLRFYREEVDTVTRARRTLKILRGEENGAISEHDARCLARFDTFRHQCPELSYESPTLSADLRLQLNDPNWKVIRVGGRGHWYALVRNQDGRTVDEINDSWVNRRAMTIDQIHQRWSNPDAWRGARGVQIHFY